MSQRIDESEPIYSSLGNDPDLGGIVGLFVEEMAGRVATLLSQLEVGDWQSLRRTAHQLKGAAGSYGFHAVSPYAGKVEDTILDGEPEERIRAATDELVGICRRVRAGSPG